MTILLKPIITEKSMLDASRGVYTFAINPTANKYQVKQLVSELFSVHVIKVTTSTTKPINRRTGRKRLPAKTSLVKIARVWLKQGETISLFDLKEEQ